MKIVTPVNVQLTMITWWWSGIAVTRWSRSTKLTYGGSG